MRVPLTIGDYLERAAFVFGDREALVDEPAAEAGEGDGDEGGKDPAPSLAEQLTKTPEAVEPAVSELEKAAAFCAASTQAELNLLGGLQACANAYLEGGAHAVSLLLASLSLGGLFKP